jgi:probable HAF family extracellular repeat protein
MCRRVMISLLLVILSLGQSGCGGADKTETPQPSNTKFIISDLGTLGGGDSYATGINNAGLIVGKSMIGNFVDSHAFIYSNGTMTDLGTLPGNNDNSFAHYINDLGQVVGDSNGQAFLFSNGAMSAIHNGYAYGINKNGQIVGDYYSSSGYNHAYLFSSGHLTDLGTFGGNYSYAYGINDLGQVVGQADTNNGDSRAFFFSNGLMTDLGVSGRATGINNSGQIVGFMTTPSGQNHAFIGTTRMIDIGTLSGDTDSFPTGINSFGQVVGQSVSSPGVFRAFLYRNGQMMNLNSMVQTLGGWTLTSATGINDVGEIVGTGIVNGHHRAFLLTPLQP